MTTVPQITSVTPEQLKAAWIEDLRSGQFTQVNGQLRNSENGRCCLGVLVDTTLRLCPEFEPLREEWEQEGAFAGMAETLPYSFSEQMGLTEQGDKSYGGTSEFDPEGAAYRGCGCAACQKHPPTAAKPASLAVFNDGGIGFAKIADIIEHQLVVPASTE